MITDMLCSVADGSMSRDLTITRMVFVMSVQSTTVISIFFHVRNVVSRLVCCLCALLFWHTVQGDHLSGKA